jgi:transposase
MRFLLVEAAQAAVRFDPEWRRHFLHLAMRRERSLAKVAMARKLAVRLYWMWRQGRDYQQTVQFGSHVGQPVTGHGVK